MFWFGGSTSQRLSQANQDRDARKWRSAARNYQAYLNARPSDGHIWVQLGHCLKEDSRFAEAAQAYDHARGLMPDDADLYVQIGHLHKLQGDRHQAISAYRRALEIDSERRDAIDELRGMDVAHDSGANQIRRDDPPPDQTPEARHPAEPEYDPHALVHVERDRAANAREAAADPERMKRSAEAIAKLYGALPAIWPAHEPGLIPKMLHFVYGFKEKGDIPYYGYMAIRSALHFNPGWIAYYYTMHEPSGPNWARIRNSVNLVLIDDFDYFGNARLHHYAHKADIVRMIVLTAVGGVYLDLDSITKKSFADLREHDFVMGVQAAGPSSSSGLCNAIMMGKPNAKFSTRWLSQYDYFRSRGRDDLWDYHSVKMPVTLAAKYPDDLMVLDYRAFFYPLWTSIQRSLFSDQSQQYKDDFEPAYAFHLWNGATGEWLDQIDDEFVRNSPSIYAQIAREVEGWAQPTALGAAIYAHSKSSGVAAAGAASSEGSKTSSTEPDFDEPDTARFDAARLDASRSEPLDLDAAKSGFDRPGVSDAEADMHAGAGKSDSRTSFAASADSRRTASVARPSAETRTTARARQSDAPDAHSLDAAQQPGSSVARTSGSSLDNSPTAPGDQDDCVSSEAAASTVDTSDEGSSAARAPRANAQAQSATDSSRKSDPQQ